MAKAYIKMITIHSGGNMRRFGIVLLMLMAITLTLSAIDTDAILGYWITEDVRSVVEVSKTGEIYRAQIVALKEANYIESDNAGTVGSPRLDDKNPDAALKSRPVLGLKMMDGFTFKKATWKKGKIYDPKTGKTYQCKMSFKKDGTLGVRGYVGIPALGRTTVWERPEALMKRTNSETIGYEYPSPLLK